ncbi:MAG TPA: HWE histidine kinase domain-containing protein [Xanthobacteraceae bacterium]|nr:HWE histidine kinase domain-containing protein [Xanthobacteraceae bacterium]
MDSAFTSLSSFLDSLPPWIAFWRETMPPTLRDAAQWLAAIAFFLIPAGILWAAWRRSDLGVMRRALAWAAFGIFFVFAAWLLAERINATFVLPTVDALAATSVVAGLVIMIAYWIVFVRVGNLPSPARLLRERREAEANLEAAEARTRDSEVQRIEMDQILVAKKAELALLASRLDTCLRGAKVYLFSQDRELRYVGVFGPRGDDAGAQMLGRTDEDLFPEPDRAALMAVKQKVLESGEPAEIEVWHEMPEGRLLFALHVEQMRNASGEVTGIRSAAADITRIRSLEAEQRRLAEELRNALHRYEIALRGSNVTIFTHDRDLRYTSISNAFLGRRIDQIVGLTDEDVVPLSDRETIVALKRRALESGEPEDAELRLKGPSSSRWYDFHVEPLRDAEGRVVGLTCAAVDITERKAGEEHLRLLMRELTHRSKNLLAVIQALARQTSRHAGSVDAFLEQFSERLQALSRSHDLLVQEQWHSASLTELIRSQLGHYLDREDSRVTVSGPDVHLKPEAAQSLGLALHEMAVNAAKYGALSVPGGNVSIIWEDSAAPDGGITIRWLERGGPPVEQPKKHGFGTIAIQRNLSRALEADVDLNFARDGVACTIAIPEKHLFVHEERAEAAAGT